MVFTVPASKASVKQNRFEFKMPKDPKTYSVPKMQFIKPSLIEALEGEAKSIGVRKLLDAYHPGLFEKFEEQEQATKFFEAWAAASGIKPGESSDSSAS